MVSLCMSGNQWEKYLAMELYSQLEESSSFLVGSTGIIRLQLEHYTNGGAMSVGYWPSDLGMAAVIVGALKEDKQVSEQLGPHNVCVILSRRRNTITSV